MCEVDSGQARAVASELLRLKNTGARLEINVKMDDSTSVTEFRSRGITWRTSLSPKIHRKAAVIKNCGATNIVVFGKHNWNKGSLSVHDDYLVVGKNPGLVTAFEANHDRWWTSATQYS